MHTNNLSVVLLAAVTIVFLPLVGCDGGTSVAAGASGGTGTGVAYGGATFSSSGGSTLTGGTTTGDCALEATLADAIAAASPATLTLSRGINLGNRLDAPTEGAWGPTLLETDFTFVASRGFDHIRLPVRFNAHAGQAAPYTIDCQFFKRVDWALGRALSAGLSVVLDLHHYDELHATPASHRDRFLALWDQIAQRYATLPAAVAFELLNEPHDQLDSLWNEYSAAALARVRITNPDRIVVIDGPNYSAASSLFRLVLPSDTKVVAAAHLYEPTLFSFQGMSWMGAGWETTGIVFPGPPAAPITPSANAQKNSWMVSWFNNYNTAAADTNPSGPKTITDQLNLLEQYRTSSGHEVYNNEWGPQDGGDMVSRANLVAAMKQECERRKVGWTIWEDHGHMKLFDSTAGTWETAIVNGLLP